MERVWGGKVPLEIGVYLGAVWKMGRLPALCCQGLRQLDLGDACWGNCFGWPLLFIVCLNNGVHKEH